MVAIEFKRVLKESVVLVAVLVGLFIGILATDKDVYLAPLFEIFLLVYASFTGWSMFDKERSDGAMEYLLSLPVSRVRLLLLKFMPRAVSVGFMLVFYMFLHGRFEFPSLLPVVDFSVFYIAFFLVSLSLSLSFKSFISAFFLTILLSGGLTFLHRLLDTGISDSSLYLQSNALLLIFPVLFFILFHFYDIRPAFSFHLKFAGLALVILILGLSYFSLGTNWCQYVLIDGRKIFRVSIGQSQLINEKKEVIKRFPGHQFPLLQQGNSLYVEKSKGHRFAESINRLNLETGASEVLYPLSRGWQVIFDSPESTGITSGENFYVLLGNKEEKKYRVVEIANTGVKEIPITGNFNKEKGSWYDVSLVYVIPGPLGFIVSRDKTLYRVDGAGNTEALLTVESLSLWKNRLAVFNENGMTLFDISAGGELQPLFEKKGNIRMVRRRAGSIYSRKVIVRDQERRKYSIFNLENPGFKEIPMPYNPYFYLEKGGRFIIVWASGDEISLGEIKDGRWVMKKEWVTSVPVRVIRIMRVYNPGIVIFNPREFETYWFEP